MHAEAQSDAPIVFHGAVIVAMAKPGIFKSCGEHTRQYFIQYST